MKRIDWTGVLLLLGALVFLALCFAPAHAEKLLWLAPGDDGDVGRATRYELRYRNVAPTADSLSWWNAATNVTSMPTPSVAGATDSVSVTLDPALPYWFILRAADEVSNWSGFSNVATRAPVSPPPDTTPPARPRALRIVP